MPLPWFIIMLLTKGQQKRYIQYVWDKKTDSSILESFEDAADWINLKHRMSIQSDVMNGIANDCIIRLREYIVPQLIKRNLLRR